MLVAMSSIVTVNWALWFALAKNSFSCCTVLVAQKPHIQTLCTSSMNVTLATGADGWKAGAILAKAMDSSGRSHETLGRAVHGCWWVQFLSGHTGKDSVCRDQDWIVAANLPRVLQRTVQHHVLCDRGCSNCSRAKCLGGPGEKPGTTRRSGRSAGQKGELRSARFKLYVGST